MIDTIAVGSENPVKLQAVRNSIQRVWPQAEVCGVAVASGVRAQPLSDEEAILGATNRAQTARRRLDSDLGIGLEGNTTETAYGVFVTGWAVAVDRAGTVGIGGSGRFLLPNALAHRLRQGEELGHLMDEWAGQSNTKQKQGAVGIMTNGLISRTEALETAVTFALTRFLNPPQRLRALFSVRTGFESRLFAGPARGSGPPALPRAFGEREASFAPFRLGARWESSPGRQCLTDPVFGQDPPTD